VAYADIPSDDTYVFGRTQDSDIVYGAQIGEGKFAVILKANVLVEKLRKIVAAKMLRSKLIMNL